MMRNAPHHRLDAASLGEGDRSQRPFGDVPVVRIGVLMLVLAAPVVAIGARLIWIQGELTETFTAAWNVTTTVEEPIPCRDGRILSADGQILAHDRLRYDLQVHYRWLEQPPDERWLAQQALVRLDRRDRRDQAKVAAAKQHVLEQRRRLWELLSTTLDRPRQELEVSRTGIQTRVEHIVESVTRRRNERLAETSTDSHADTSLFDEDFAPLTKAWWARLQKVLVGQLTTAPSRGRLDPVIVREELDYHTVATDIGLNAVTAIETAPSVFPGVTLVTSSERVYPQADAAGHIIGVRTELKPDELESDGSDAFAEEPTIAGDRIGRNGIERSFDAKLRGRHGTRQIVRNRGGEIISQEIIQKPAPGEDLILTIDLGLQRAAERLLDEALDPLPQSSRSAPSSSSPSEIPQGGCLVVMDVRTGDVLTAAAAPRHNLQLLTNPDPEEWQAAISDPRRPFFPRVTRMAVAPGSVFKILTAVAALESGMIDPDEPKFCQGYLDSPDSNRCYIFRHYGVGHGDVTLSDAICQSCNVYFFTAARPLGPAVISDWASRFGLGVPTGAEVPGERAGHLPRAGSNGAIVDEPWYAGSTLQFAIGQASLTTTPLQVVRMIAAVANGGYLVTPRFVSPGRTERLSAPSEIELAGYQSDLTPPTIERIHGLSQGTLERVRDAMTMVVQSSEGTGRKAAIEGISLAGKTGTAEVGGGKNDHAWFVGFVPAEAPRYAFVVVLEHGGSGGSTAAPLAGEFIETMIDAGLLRRDSQVMTIAE